MTNLLFKTVDNKFYAAVSDAVKDFIPQDYNKAIQQIKERVEEDVEEYEEEMKSEYMEYSYTLTKTPNMFEIYSFSKYTKTEIPDKGVGYEIVRITRTENGPKLEIY